MAGEHAAEHGEGVEKQVQAAGDHQPGKQAAEHQNAEGGFHHHRYQEDHYVGHNHKGQARQVVGQKQTLPPHGQRVQKGGRAAGIEVGEHRHGCKDAEKEGEHSGGAEGARQKAQGDDAGIHPAHIFPVDQDVHRQQHQPQQPVQPPDGPEAGQVFPQQGKIKVRCRGPHSPHLPAHK